VLNAELKLEIRGNEYEFEGELKQYIFEMIPTTQYLEFQLVLADDENVKIEYKKGNKKIVFEGDLKFVDNGYLVEFSTSNRIKELKALGFPRKFKTTSIINLSEQTLKTEGEIVRKNKEENTFQFDSGLTTEGFFANFNHDIQDFFVPRQSNMNANFVKEYGQFDFTLKTELNKKVNAATLSISYGVHPENFYYKMDFNHDYEIFALDQNLGLAFGGQISETEAELSFNITTSDNFFKHYCKVDYRYTEKQLSYGISLIQNNYHLTGLGVPESAQLGFDSLWEKSTGYIEGAIGYTSGPHLIKSKAKLSADCSDHDYRLAVINKISVLSTERSDSFAVRANYNNMQPVLQVVLGIQEWKQAGLPKNIALELSNNNEDIFDWTLHCTADKEKASLRLLGDFDSYDVTRIVAGVTFEHDIKKLIDFVPNNISANFEGQFQNWLVWSTSLGGKYGLDFLNVFIKEENEATKGTSIYTLQTNMIDPKTNKWHHECSWSSINDKISVVGFEQRDNVDWYKYSFGLNTKNTRVTLTFNLDDEVDFEFDFDSKKLTNPSEQITVPLTATYVNYNNKVYSVNLKVYKKSYGSQYGISYDDGIINIDARCHYVNKNFGILVTSKNCDWTPENLNLQITTAPFHMISYLKYRDIELLNADITLESSGKISFKASNLNNDLIASLDGKYDVADTEFTMQIPFYKIDHTLKTDYSFIQGKIAFTANLNSHTNDEENAKLDFYIKLHSNDWSDIKSELQITSSFEQFDNDIKVVILSSKNQQTGVQTVTVTSSGFGRKSEAVLKVGVEVFEFHLDVGSDTYGASTSHNRGPESVSRTGSIRWGGPEDKVDFNIEWSSMNLKRKVSLVIDQPSKTLGFSSINIESITDLSTPRLTTDLDGSIDLGQVSYGGQINAAYEGNYETLFGTHKGEIQLSYGLEGSRYSTHSANAVVTILDKTINTNLEIKNSGATLLKISEEFTYGTGSYDITVSVKQSVFQKINLDFIEVSNSFTLGETTTSTGSLQFNNNPITRYSGSLTNKPSQYGFDYELDLSLSSGGLAPYVNFRTLNINGIQKQVGNLPSFSWTVELDNDEYHLSLKNTQTSNPRTSNRVKSEASFRHPHDLSVFGMRLPKSNDLNSLFLQTRKGVKITLTYANELLVNPITITNSLVLKQDEATIVEGKLSIDFSQEDNENFGLQYSLTKERNEYEYSAVISVTSPKLTSPFNLKVSSINTPEEGEKGIYIKFNWEQINDEGYEFKVTYDVLSIWRFDIKLPGQEKMFYAGDLGSILSQLASYVGQLYQNNQSNEELAHFISGTESVDNGVDLFFGVGNLFGREYTLHLLAEKVDTNVGLSLKIKEDMETTEIGAIKMSLIRGKLIKLSLKANPTIGSMVNSIAGIIDSNLQNNIDVLSDNIISLLETLTNLISESSFASDKLNQFIRYITENIKSARSETSKFVTDVTTGLTSTISIDLQKSIKSGIVLMLEKVNEFSNQFLAPVQEIIDSQKTEFVSDIQATVVDNLQFTRPVFDIFNAADLFFTLVEEAVEKSLSYLDANISALILKMRGPVKDLVVVNKNEVVISLPLAFKVDTFSITEIPSVEDMKVWFTQTALSRKIEELVTIAYGYMDTFYLARAVYYTPLSEQRPPFKGHAIVADFKHYRTFDGKYFDFSSKCDSSHILATDGKDLTITLTYGEEPTYGVMYGNEWISIGFDGSVSSNKKSVDLPYKNKFANSKLTAVRHADLIVVKHTDKIEATFDISTKLFVLNINPFYFASVGGLLGTFNNEPNFDFTSPSGTRIQDVSTFAYKWEISDVKCSHTNAYESIENDDSATKTCNDYFKDYSSDARACFPVVPVEDFYAACMKDKADFCKIAKAYYTTCTLYGALVSLPAQCIECDAVKGSGFSGENEKEFNVQGVDVVFVMQEAQCIKDKAKDLGKFVKKFIKEAGKAFKKNKLKSTNYYLVGYGGAIEQPHTYTLKGGKISSGKKSDIVKRIKKITPVGSQEAGDDGMSAVMYAASALPFRGGSHQVLIHITCDACNVNTPVSLAEVNAFLNERGIAYHHMPMNSIATTSRSKKVYGYTMEKSFIKGNREVDRNIIVENSDDLCVQVAMENVGAVWDGTNMKSSDFTKTLYNEVVNNFASSARKTCTCQLNGYGQAVTKCVTV